MTSQERIQFHWRDVKDECINKVFLVINTIKVTIDNVKYMTNSMAHNMVAWKYALTL